MKRKLTPDCPDCGETDEKKFGNDKSRWNRRSHYCLICLRLRKAESWAKRKAERAEAAAKC